MSRATGGELRERVNDLVWRAETSRGSACVDLSTLNEIAAALNPAIAPAGPNIAAAWHKARNAWMKFSRNSTQAAGDAAAIAALTTALNAAPQDGEADQPVGGW